MQQCHVHESGRVNLRFSQVSFTCANIINVETELFAVEQHKRSLASLGNCSCIALIPSIPGHMLPKSGRRLRSTALIIKLALDKTIIAQSLNAAPASEMRYI